MSTIRQTFPLGTQWPTIDPFLFVAHHLDDYPAANDRLGPDTELDGRDLGQDFGGKDGWNMYHGLVVPGFPQHPHRGFETVTYVRTGRIDHADSLGATARFGDGDTQWMTAGSGVQHCEMFPLLRQDEPNPLELFQIWLNLPAEDKMVDPYFTMLWRHDTPKLRLPGTQDPATATDVTVIAGELFGETPATPPPNSWAARSQAEVAIWHLSFEPGADIVLPAVRGAATERVLYAFEGSFITIGDERLDAGNGALLDGSGDVTLIAGPEGVEVLILQGAPIAEPVARYGPFVMNTDAEIQQAFADYRATQFGGWPWPSAEPNHGPSKGRFAIHGDGRIVDADAFENESAESEDSGLQTLG